MQKRFNLHGRWSGWLTSTPSAKLALEEMVGVVSRMAALNLEHALSAAMKIPDMKIPAS
jgi:hypothetical protein